MPSPSPSAPLRPAAHPVGYSLGIIALALGMLGLAAAFGLSSLIAHQRTVESRADAPPVSRTLLGKQLTIPAAWLRGLPPKQQGFATQVSLEIGLPLGKNGTLVPIDVTLVPLSQARPSASLLDGVYLHQFMPNELSGPPGLVGKPLYGTEGYENEVVWYDALSQNPFVAKCITPPADEAGPSRCLRTVAISSGIAAIYAFDADVLYAWQGFDAALQQPLTQIGLL